MSRSTAMLLLLATLIAYLAIGTAFAFNTPDWQNPDEPAHYNYIKFIVKQQALPVLENGDYDQAHIERFTQTPQNTHSLSIDPFRYEFYAPPLYYLLTAPIYAATEGWLTALRLFSVILGGALVVVAYKIGAELFPDRLQIAVGAAAFIAFVPQHMAMLSAVDNDVLAELLIALCVWQALRLLKSDQPSERSFYLLGVTLGLGLLTKQTVYYTAVPIVFIALALQWRNVIASEAKQSPRQSAEIASAQKDAPRNDVSLVTRRTVLTRYSLTFIPALLLGSIWWLHNLQIYGGLDVLGLARHNSIVVGQATSADWIAQYGFGGLISRGLTTTFHSFWGQFGWMAVPMPDSTYLLLGLLSIVALGGWMWWLIGMRNAERGHLHRAADAVQVLRSIRPQALLLVLLVGLTVGGFVYYNLTFVQHQGRYLFPALIPIGLVVAIGLDHILQKLFGLIKKPSEWTWMIQMLIFAAVFIMLARLDVIALQRYIIPFLSP